jgi:hypothetical protein
MKRLTLPRSARAAVLAAMLSLCSVPCSFAQDDPGASKGENFSAKPPAQLFASDCTGSGCHKSPQGLAKAQGLGSLAGFLREHYTNSRESAAALAGYLSKLPAGPEQREPKEARTPRPAKPVAEPASNGPGWFGGSAPSEPAAAKPEPKPKPEPKEARTPRHNQSRTSRAARAEEEKEKETPAATPGGRHQPAEAPPKPAANARAQRGKQPATAAAAPLPLEPPPPPAAPPPPKQYDIFD